MGLVLSVGVEGCGGMGVVNVCRSIGMDRSACHVANPTIGIGMSCHVRSADVTWSIKMGNVDVQGWMCLNGMIPV
jgi:hypothetical protein